MANVFTAISRCVVLLAIAGSMAQTGCANWHAGAAPRKPFRNPANLRTERRDNSDTIVPFGFSSQAREIERSLGVD